jgi:hypothetical protein
LMGSIERSRAVILLESINEDFLEESFLNLGDELTIWACEGGGVLDP